jgi:hypothetical protein
MTAKTNLRQFPGPTQATQATVASVKMSRKAAAAAAMAGAATAAATDEAEQMDIMRINTLTSAIFAISLNPAFKSSGYTMDQLAAAALSVSMQHMSGVSEAAVASVAEAYPQRS